MAATCAGFRGAQEKPSCKPSSAATCARSEASKRELQGTQRLDAPCLRDFKESLKHEPRQAIFMEKPMETAWVW